MKNKILIMLLLSSFLTGCFNTTEVTKEEPKEEIVRNPYLEMLEKSLEETVEVDDMEEYLNEISNILEDKGYTYEDAINPEDTKAPSIHKYQDEYVFSVLLAYDMTNDVSGSIHTLFLLYLNDKSDYLRFSISDNRRDDVNTISISVSYVNEENITVSLNGTYNFVLKEYTLTHYTSDQEYIVENFRDYDVKSDVYGQMPKIEEAVEVYLTEYYKTFKDN